MRGFFWKITFLTIISFLIAFFAFPPKTLAQPTNKFDCQWTSTGPGTGYCGVNLSTIACAPGYCTNPVDCAIIFQSACESQLGNDCIPCGTPTPIPGVGCTGESTGLPGICKSTLGGCGSGYENDGQDTCSFGESCCVVEDFQCFLAGGECALIVAGRCPAGEGYYPEPLGAAGELGCGGLNGCCKPLPPGCCTYSLISGCPGPGQNQCPSDPLLYCSNLDNCPFGSIFPGEKVNIDIYCDSDGNPTNTPRPENPPRLYTAIGCIPFGTGDLFVAFILRWGLGIGGGIAFLLIIIAAFQITTSSGDPKKLQAGKELLTSAVAGLVLLILSALILELIGVKLLNIPGFG